MAGSSGEVVQAVISEVHPCWGVHWCPGASTEEGSSCSLLGNVPTVLRSLVTHGDTARSCSPSPGASSCRGRVGLNLPCPDQSPLAFPGQDHLPGVPEPCRTVSWAAGVQVELGCCTPGLPALTPSSSLNTDRTSGPLEGDVAKGCTQGGKLSIFSGLNQEGLQQCPWLWGVYTHTHVWTCTRSLFKSFIVSIVIRPPNIPCVYIKLSSSNRGFSSNIYYGWIPVILILKSFTITICI